jgi:uncharacterized protein (DUF58 family)
MRWMMLTRPIRFTRFGTFYILFSIGVGAAAINTGNNLLYLILGILLGFIVISGFLSDSGLWGITTEWIPAGSFYAGQKAIFTCLTRKGWFPGVAVTVESHWRGLSPVASFVPWIPARGNASVRVQVIPPRRGTLTLERCLYSTRFPFGLFQKSHTRILQERWIVYPHAEHLPREWIESAGENLSPTSSHRQGIGSVPYVLRDYRAGDALRQVQWKASAKRRRLIVKETEEEADQGDLFYLNAWPTDFNEPKREAFISFVASLILTTHDLGRPVGLATPEQLFLPDHSRAHLHRIFKFLALVDPSKNHARKTQDFKGHRVIDVLSMWHRHPRMPLGRYI